MSEHQTQRELAIVARKHDFIELAEKMPHFSRTSLCSLALELSRNSEYDREFLRSFGYKIVEMEDSDWAKAFFYVIYNRVNLQDPELKDKLINNFNGRPSEPAD